MVYSFVDHPADQVDQFGVTHHFSGTITTDGMLGILTDVDIRSWEVTFDGTSTMRSTHPDAVTRGFGLIATQDSLTLPTRAF